MTQVLEVLYQDTFPKFRNSRQFLVAWAKIGKENFATWKMSASWNSWKKMLQEINNPGQGEEQLRGQKMAGREKSQEDISLSDVEKA